jgi:hypothetical protein
MKALVLFFTAMSQLQFLPIAKAEGIQGELGAINAALQVRNQIVTALEKKDFTEITHDSMGGAVSLLADELRNKMLDEDMAAQLENVWTEGENAFFTVEWRDLGDHDPYIPQLEEFLTQLADKYGTVIYSLPLVEDIRTINFAVPVVFHPKGAWQKSDVDNRIEYRKHFIPFANIVTFYGSLVACNYFATKSQQPDLKKVCQPAAEKLKFAMGRYIAPPISDWIFNQTNNAYFVSQSQLHYRNAEELRAAIYR